MNAKKTIFPLVCALALCACEEQIIDMAGKDTVPSKVYFLGDPVRQIDYLDTGDPGGSFSLAICKSGIRKEPVSARIGVLTPEELDAYNRQTGHDFVLIHPDVYAIGEREFFFSGGYDDLSRNIRIDFDLELLRSVADNAVLPLKIRQSSARINEERSLVVLKPRVREVTIAFADGVKDVNFVDNGALQKDIRLSLEALLGLEENRWDVDLELRVDEEYVAQYNARESTSYELLASDCYSLQPQSTIKAGRTDASFLLQIEKEKIARPGQYMLPVRLKSSSRFAVDPNSLYCIRIDIWSGAKLDRTGWEVVLYNTYEPAESGADNKYFPYGYPQAILDGDVASYWHSQWKPTKVPPPHYLVIDMLAPHLIEQVELIQRQKNFASKDVELYMGSDLAPLAGLESITEVEKMQEALAGIDSWKKIAAVQMKAEAVPQIFNVTRTSGRYLLLLITSSHRPDSITSLSEVYPYGN